MHWTCSLWVIVFLGQTLPGLARKSRSGLRQDRLSGCTGARPLPSVHPNAEINRGRKARLTFWSWRTFGHCCQKQEKRKKATRVAFTLKWGWRTHSSENRETFPARTPALILTHPPLPQTHPCILENAIIIDPFAYFDTETTKTYNQISDTRRKYLPPTTQPAVGKVGFALTRLLFATMPNFLNMTQKNQDLEGRNPA